MRLKGRRALVTGASAGLGAAVAMELAREGAAVVINSRDPQRLDNAAAKIKAATGIVPVTIAANVATGEGLEKIARTVCPGGKCDIDILFSNAGGPPPGQFLALDENAFPDAAQLVLDAAIKLTRIVLGGMVERKWGRLIYLTSVGVLQPLDNLLLSNTYRSAVAAFCKTISNNYAQYGITANCVCPGYTATERLENLARQGAKDAGLTPEAVIAGYAANIPARRVGRPEELGALVAFLASDRAAYITGTSIPVDGGFNKALI
ncbi:MAG: SDR family oxidoreductase [Candidatus Zixiibacteriota bacterium]